MRKQDTLKVSDNQRRTISTTLIMLDEMLCEFDRIAAGQETRSIMYAEKNSLSAKQKAQLRGIMTTMREIIRQIKERLSLETEEVNLANRIWSSASAFWEVLIETKSERLKGYGTITPSLADFINPKIDELIKHLTGIVETMNTSALGKKK
ncbi:MAG: hypothetical protein NC823_00570 [Candidatus Omnitrophica bacterium]|nr:hypothetical protein [Candidatus Omnitrophota bacterium]